MRVKLHPKAIKDGIPQRPLQNYEKPYSGEVRSEVLKYGIDGLKVLIDACNTADKELKGMNLKALFGLNWDMDSKEIEKNPLVTATPNTIQTKSSYVCFVMKSSAKDPFKNLRLGTLA